MKSVTCCLFLLSCLVGCVTDPLPIDGTWNVVMTMGAGTCAAPGRTETTTVLVVRDGDDYEFQFSPPNPDDEVSGSARCVEDSCDVDLEFVTHDGAATFTFDLEMEIDSDLVVSGTGTLDASGSASSCTQNLTIAGTIF